MTLGTPVSEAPPQATRVLPQAAADLRSSAAVLSAPAPWSHSLQETLKGLALPAVALLKGQTAVVLFQATAVVALSQAAAATAEALSQAAAAVEALSQVAAAAAEALSQVAAAAEALSGSSGRGTQATAAAALSQAAAAEALSQVVAAAAALSQVVAAAAALSQVAAAAEALSQVAVAEALSQAAVAEALSQAAAVAEAFSQAAAAETFSQVAAAAAGLPSHTLEMVQAPSLAYTIGCPSSAFGEAVGPLPPGRGSTPLGAQTPHRQGISLDPPGHRGDLPVRHPTGSVTVRGHTTATGPSHAVGRTEGDNTLLLGSKLYLGYLSAPYRDHCSSYLPLNDHNERATPPFIS
ncbi:UNVERIFIED_CONTAM: hypothetical protein FKN15_033978 [Acipenser sinensis]